MSISIVKHVQLQQHKWWHYFMNILNAKYMIHIQIISIRLPPCNGTAYLKIPRNIVWCISNRIITICCCIRLCHLIHNSSTNSTNAHRLCWHFLTLSVDQIRWKLLQVTKSGFVYMNNHQDEYLSKTTFTQIFIEPFIWES